MATSKKPAAKKNAAKKKDTWLPIMWTLIGIQKNTGSAIHVECDSLQDCKDLCNEKNVDMSRPVYARDPDGKMHSINSPQ